MAKIRSLICACLGHVDHGKSSLLDKIRDTAIVDTEPGRITQAIGASIIPLDSIKEICGPLLERLKMEFTIPGLLMIDTPGHAAFTSLRKRGGNLADIAILVVDINEGFKPQTIEAIEILRSFKTPFVIAANKVDLINGWQRRDDDLLKNISLQSSDTLKLFETKLYNVVGQLFDKFQLNGERFDRIEDYTKQIAVIPTSAVTGEGIPELLMVISGLAQKFLEQCLECNVDGPAKGTILEVKEEKGLGVTMDVILYDGTLRVNDQVVIGGVDGPIVAKVRALFEPAPLSEMRDKKSKFKSVKEVSAAAGVKISCPNLVGVVAGMPLRSATKDSLERIRGEVAQEVQESLIQTDSDGVIIKADTLGSLEALTNLLRAKGVLIAKASIGNISKKDVSEADSKSAGDPLLGVVLGFNIVLPADVSVPSSVKVLTDEVIYSLIDKYELWKVEKNKELEAGELDRVVRPCKIELLKGYVFRQNNPAIVGVEVVAGVLKSGIDLMKKDGKSITTVKTIQADKESVNKAEKGKQVAVSFEHVTVGRQINEGDVLFSVIPESDFRKFKEFKKYLSVEEIDLLREIADIMRKDNPVWGV